MIPQFKKPEKTKYKYLEFIYLPDDKKWEVRNHKYRQHLGELEYNHGWKCWEFYPEEGTGFDKSCLLDLADFINQITV